MIELLVSFGLFMLALADIGHGLWSMRLEERLWELERQVEHWQTEFSRAQIRRGITAPVFLDEEDAA